MKVSTEIGSISKLVGEEKAVVEWTLRDARYHAGEAEDAMGAEAYATKTGVTLVKAGVNGFVGFRNVGFVEEDTDFVECEVVFDPLKALACGFKLCKVVEVFILSADNSGNHSGCVNNALVNNS